MNVAQQQFAGQSAVRPLVRPMAAASHVALGLVVAFGLVLAVRRIMLAKAEPLSLWSTLATAAVLLLLVYAIRRAAAGAIFPWVPTAVLLFWAVVCSWPGSQPGAWVIWSAAIASDWWLMHLLRPGDSSVANAPVPPGGSMTPQALEPTAEIAENELEQLGEGHLGQEPEGDEPLGAGKPGEDGEIVLQHIVRVRDADGREYVHATLRGELAAGQRRTTLHVGFCPPFPTLPEVEAEVIEGPAAVAKVTQTLHNGVQVEVELDTAELEASVVTVEVAAYEGEGSAVSG